MSFIFSRIAGLSGSTLSQMPRVGAFAIEMTSAFALLSSMLCTGLTGYLFYFCTESVAISVIAGSVVFAIFIATQMLLNAVRGNGLASKINSAQATGPSVIHVLAYLSLTLVFTQPALLLFSKNIYATQVADAIKFDHNLRLRNFDELRAEGARQLKRDALIYSEKIIQLGAQPLRSPGDASPPLAPTTSSTQPLSPSTSTKKALVIGNQHYPTSPLRAPIKDANDIAQALRSAGYQVSLVTDGSRLILEQRINQYTQSLNAFDTSVFFYSGHGFQHAGNNYMVPVDMVSIDQGIGLNLVLQKISHRKPLVNIVIIDACHAYASDMAISQSGLAMLEGGDNTYVALAAKPGQAAQEPNLANANGFFTKAILNSINKPIDIDMLFRDVRLEVFAATKGAQSPISWSTLSRSFILMDPQRTLTAPTATLTATASPAVADRASEQNSQGKYSCQQNYVDSNTAEPILIACYQTQLLRAHDDLAAYHQQTKKLRLALEDSLTQYAITPPRMMRLYQEIWEGADRTKRSTLLTILIWLALASAFIAREMLIKPLRDYVLISHEDRVKDFANIRQRSDTQVKEIYARFIERLRTITSLNFNVLNAKTPQLLNPIDGDGSWRSRSTLDATSNRAALQNLMRALRS
jgi:uncharacterized caspase-like protein